MLDKICHNHFRYSCPFYLQLGFALTQILDLKPMLELGIFTAGVAPGGGASNVWAFMMGGDIDLSITMTFISSIFCMGEFINFPW